MAIQKDKFFKWGLCLVIIGYLVSLNPYWLIFGTPLVYFTGVVFIYLSSKRLITKSIIIIAPILLWLPGYWGLIYFGTNHVPPETFLIPQNFRGKIVLYYDEPYGKEIGKEDGRYIYHVPNNGIMVLKNKLETGIINQRYFIVDSTLKITKELPLFIQQNFNEEYTLERNKYEPPRNKLAVFLGGTGTGTTNTGSYKFQEIYVNTYDSLRVFNNSKFDTRALSFLDSCRLKTNKKS
jgi:hypothetical protein